MKFSAVILAGGKSSRMGRDKAWLKVDGELLLARQIRLVREIGAREVFVSGRAGVDYSEFGGRVLRDRLVDVGPMAGIERALTETADSLLLVLAVDMPRMTAEFLRRLLSCCDDHVGVVPRLNGRVEPLAALYPKTSLNLINEMILASKVKGVGDELLHGERRFLSARGFAEKCLEGKFTKFFDVTESEANYFSNWNSPQDVEEENRPDFIG